MNGVSLLLIEKTMPGVSTRHMPCSGVWASGTSYVTFEVCFLVNFFLCIMEVCILGCEGAS
jgi:hypothetical protein